MLTFAVSLNVFASIEKHKVLKLGYRQENHASYLVQMSAIEKNVSLWTNRAGGK